MPMQQNGLSGLNPTVILAGIQRLGVQIRRVHRRISSPILAVFCGWVGELVLFLWPFPVGPPAWGSA